MKESRVEFRSSPQEKDLIALAAELSGINVSSFLREAALKEANKIVQDYESLKLSQKDRDIFLKVLDDSPEPTSRLKRSMKRYKKQQDK